MKKLRILCLHGYHGNAAVLRHQMNGLTAGLEHLAEFVYVDAPSLAQGDFGWWHAKREEIGRGGIAYYQGWEKTQAAIISLFEKQGPFDGIFGFSQGATLAALLVGLRAPDGVPSKTQPLVFRFACMVGGFMVLDPLLANFYHVRASYTLPSVHIIGRMDFIVPADDSHQLSRLFAEPLVLEHDGGHVVAATPAIRRQMADFLTRQMDMP